MTIQTALIPNKHTRFNDAIITLAGRLMLLLEQPRTIDELWAIVSNCAKDWGVAPSFTHLVLAVDTLCAIRQIELVADGRIQKSNTP